LGKTTFKVRLFNFFFLAIVENFQTFGQSRSVFIF